MKGLAAEGVRVEAGGKPLLAGASLSALPGEVTGLIGPNGAGKSTLIGAMLGLRRLAAGRIGFDGADLPGMSARERARICAYVEQAASTEERLTVRDVVALGRVPFESTWQPLAADEDSKLVEAVLAEVGMAAFASRLFQTLSGGEQQRVQIARALAQAPRLLLLDEPTSHLDIQAQLIVLDLLRRRARAGCTVVLALHDLNLAARYCDRLAVMQAGRVVAEGRPAEVLDPGLLLAVYGVHASVFTAPGGAAPIVVYDRAAGRGAAPESD